MRLKDVLGILNEKSRYAKIESYLIYILLVSALVMSVGIGLTIFKTQGISAVLSMLGALMSFLSTIGLIVVWILQEINGE